MTVNDLLAKWLGKEGGAERANYQMFLTELTLALDLPAPDPKGSGLGDYQFEAPVKSAAALGTKGTGRIDLYKRDSFILEAKQSQVKPGEALPADPPAAPPVPIHDLFGNPIGYEAPKGKAAPRYDRLMADARIQAERYALALPGEHRAPPFLIVADIGRAFELYFDYTGNGRGYAFFPDQQSYRIELADLASDRDIAGMKLTPRALLRAIWTNPASVDPRLRAAEVTRQVAERLSRVAADLEKAKRLERPSADDHALALGIESTSLFVMRLLFCMFAEDVRLLPEGAFTRLLREARDTAIADERTGSHFWRASLEELWSLMDRPGTERPFWVFGKGLVRYFNGNLFRDRAVYPLSAEFIGELVVAAEKDWRKVEPAIFGTLLEQVLTVADRARLGAHYTPRVYVERLVAATIMDVLEPEWAAARDAARAAHDAGDDPAARAAVAAFHDRLVAVNVLDPACGTGNFLYVAMEQLLRLEGEAIQLATELGAPLAPRIHPNQFLGLELNPRAAVIAELVLWIGWLRHRLANHPGAIGEPVLPTLTNINGGTHGGFDAVLARTATGEPDTANPRRPPWPEADFIVGNPPFIGGQDLRNQLDAEHPGYAETLWHANPEVPKSADFVMQWWDRAANILTQQGTRLQRFGFVTTNSITQLFSRRVIARHMLVKEERAPLSLIFGIPSHPWTRASKDAAAVRIAMTVARAGLHEGRHGTVIGEHRLDTDTPEIEFVWTVATIHADLSVGTDTTAVCPLLGNAGVCHDGVKLHGRSFAISYSDARLLGIEKRPNLSSYIRPYRNGKDLSQRNPAAVTNKYVIDFFGVNERTIRNEYPEAFQHLLQSVKPERDCNRRSTYRDNWWIFGEPRREMRVALKGLARYIATVDTAKHRVFQFIPSEFVCDDKLVTVASDAALYLGILSSSSHVSWSIRLGGWLGVGNDSVYVKSKTFDPFPFPDPTPAQHSTIAEIAEELDATRKLALAENETLTMTGLYNLVAAIRAGTLPPDREAQAVRARARIVAKLHDDLDGAVAAAYGWAEDWARGDLPPAEIVARLVALNAERAAEEKAGKVRWLRPDYQIPRFAKRSSSGVQESRGS